GAEMESLLTPTSGSTRGWKPRVTGPKSNGTAIKTRRMALKGRSSQRRRGPNLKDDIHEASGNDDDLLRLLAVAEPEHAFMRDRGLGDLVAARVGRDMQVAAELAVHL